jgi:hypothetical protein
MGRYRFVYLLHDVIDSLTEKGYNAIEGDYDKQIVMKNDNDKVEIGLNSIDNPSYIYLRFKK